MLTPDICDPTVNPLYRDVLAHYCVIAFPGRVGGSLGCAPGRYPHHRPTPRRTAWVRQAIAERIRCHEGASGVRRILGRLALAKKHGPTVVEDAGNAALDLALPTYRFLRGYLER